MWQIISIILVSYLLGSINPAIEYSNRVKKTDIRNCGSGNAGMTNVLRTFGLFAAIVVFLGDILKTLAAIYISIGISNWFGGINYTNTIIVSSLVVAFGHCLPIYYEFKGGKGVLTTIVAVCIMDYKVALICLVFGLLIALITRIMSLASIFASILLPILFAIYVPQYTIYGLVIAIVILFGHRSNIQRIFEGTENKLFNKE